LDCGARFEPIRVLIKEWPRRCSSTPRGLPTRKRDSDGSKESSATSAPIHYRTTTRLRPSRTRPFRASPRRDPTRRLSGRRPLARPVRHRGQQGLRGPCRLAWASRAQPLRMRRLPPPQALQPYRLRRDRPQEERYLRLLRAAPLVVGACRGPGGGRATRVVPW
jgi:hypothetical protein